MAELIDCLLVQNASEGGLTVVSSNIAPNHIKLYIKPDNTQEGYVFAVRARDFTDYTYLLPADDIAGIASGSSNGLGITWQDTIPFNGTYNPDNQVEITVDIDDNFTVNQDTTIKIDFGGRAVALSSRDVILALKTDFDYQVRGGDFTWFNPSTGGNENLSFDGYEGVAKVTFTPYFNGVTDPLTDGFNGKTTDVPSPSNYNESNDFTKKDDIIYVQKTVEIGQWTKIGTIKVEIDTSVESTAISAGKIPSSDKGKYGFVHRNPYDAGNSFLTPSAISKEASSLVSILGQVAGDTGMSMMAQASHQLRPKDSEEYEVASYEFDEIVNVDSGLPYKYHQHPSGPWDNTSQTTAYFAEGKLTREWQREWWFKYPSPTEADQYGDVSDVVFYHSTADMNNKAFNSKNDLSLSGLLTAAPVPQALYTINEVTWGCTQCGWVQMNLLNAGLPEVSEENQDGLDDYAWLIPLNGNANGYGDQTVKIRGDVGSTFIIEIEEVDVEDFTTGRSLGDGTVSTFRNLVQWDETWGSTNEAGEMGSSAELTIPNGGQIFVELPQININTTNNIKNFYLRVIAGSETTISANAHGGEYGADIEGDTPIESFNQGLNFTGAVANTLQIRLRQNPDLFVDLIPKLDNFTSGGVALEPNTGGMSGNSITGVQLWKSNHNASGSQQNINFKFCVKGTGGYFKFKEEAYLHEGGDFINSDSLHAYQWGSGHPCANGSEEDGVCSLRNVNPLNHNVPVIKTQLWSHNYPVQFPSGPNMLSGGVEDCANCSSDIGGADWDLWLDHWNHNTSNTSHEITVTGGGSTIKIERLNLSNAGNTPFTVGRTDFGIYNYANVVVGQTYKWRVYVGTVNHCNGKIRLKEMDEPGEQYATIVGGEAVMSLGGGLESGICTAQDLQWYEGTFTPTKPIIKMELSNVGSIVGRYVEFKAATIFKDSEFEDHDQNTNGDENVSIHSLKAVKGRVTGGVSNYNGTVGGDIAIDNTGGNAHDDYLTVIGILKVQEFGDMSNVYEMDLSHIADYIV